LTAIWPDGYALAELAETHSTNVEALRRAESGEHGPLWIRADRQTHGRGRRGRHWQSEAGNLFATLLIRPQHPRPAELSFAAALAASDMLAGFAPTADIKVKWPNDVLAEGAKIAGILLETNASSDALVIGIGVNLTASPTGCAYAVTSLAALGIDAPTPGAALAHLAAAFAKWHRIWRAHGFGPLREAWLARAFRLGDTIQVHLPDGDGEGVFEGVDEGGALLLRHEGGFVTTILAGDVFFP
jgi:BirA family transcriptional regulator, biotin operon repressor / biotin---[acetyl-CoA-carboxylase] ligase